MPAVTLHNVGKRFARRVALDSVSLDVEAGECLVLLGRNGAGKTTLIRLLAGALLPDSGQVTVAGHDSARDGARVRSAVGLSLGEERSWYWRLSGAHNLEFFAALRGCDRLSARDRSRQLLAEFGLADVATTPVSAYSAGMRARLSVARALLGEPAVLLLDEPTRSLDPGARDAVHEQLRALAAGGRAIVLSSHHVDEAESVADRAVVLERGQLVAESSAPVDARLLSHALRDQS